MGPGGCLAEILAVFLLRLTISLTPARCPNVLGIVIAYSQRSEAPVESADFYPSS